MASQSKIPPSGVSGLLIFGGTTEGRLAADVCEEAGNPFYYSTKGDAQDVEMHNGVRLSGIMNADEIADFCRNKGIKAIIDAAHPFAENLHMEIAATGMPVIRLQRPTLQRMEGVTYCSDYAEAMECLQAAGVRKLLALSGANTIAKLKPYWESHHTIFRILDREESRRQAERAGLPPTHLIYYNKELALPSVESEMETMRDIGCDAIITKESGTSGGFEEKVTAALNLGIRVFVIKTPVLPYDWTFVTGRYGLRRAIEELIPDFFPLKTGLTTGACATAATKAALLSLLCDEYPEEVAFALPDGEVMTIAVEHSAKGRATVTKPNNDDPDVTQGCRITAEVFHGTGGIRFLQGDGVGHVTLPGLGIPVGEPAINPTPRLMIEREIRVMSDGSFDVRISVENGEAIAQRTFNHKVGVVGGISIIGTSGIVHPLSNEAFTQSIRREMEVARAIGCRRIGLVSGMKSERILLKSDPTLRCIHYGNFIGAALSAADELGFEEVILSIMIGKAVKLAEGHMDTHSHKVQMNKAFLCSLAPEYSDEIGKITMARELWRFMPDEFFEHVRQLCLEHCRKVFTKGKITINLVCEER